MYLMLKPGRKEIFVSAFATEIREEKAGKARQSNSPRLSGGTRRGRKGKDRDAGARNVPN